jgi:hypothetical protein
MTTKRRHILLLAACGVLALLYAALFVLNRRAPARYGRLDSVFGALIYLSAI